MTKEELEAMERGADFFGADRHYPVLPPTRIFKITDSGEAFELLHWREPKMWRRLLATPRTQITEALDIFGVADILPLDDATEAPRTQDSEQAPAAASPKKRGAADQP